MENEPQKAIRYRLNLWATVPITEGTPDLTSREVEKQTLKLLAKADFDADVEYMDAETIEE